VASKSADLYRKMIALSAVLMLVIGLFGSVIGLLIAGIDGVYSALIGALVSAVFSILTILSVWFGSKLSLTGFYGLVLGGWLLKVVLFAIALGTLQRADFISGPVFFFAVVTTVLGGLAIDGWVVLRERQAILD
jgi:F0F1-type ATP synthase assembly protein I